MIAIPMTPAQFAAVESAIVANGVKFTPSSPTAGTITTHGAAALYDYDGVNLSINCTEAPFGLHGAAEHKLASWVTANDKPLNTLTAPDVTEDLPGEPS